MKYSISSLRGTIRTLRPCPMSSVIALTLARKKVRSVFFFTQHKSASSFVSSVVNGVSACEPGLKVVDYANTITQVGGIFKFIERFSDEQSWYYQCASSLFKLHGYIYGAFRYPFLIPNWQCYKMIFFLRDPRDSLISRYHSFGFIHGIPKDPISRKEFLNEREQIHAESIDSYCLRMANEWSKPLLAGYMKMIQLRPEPPLVLTYEQFIDDTTMIIKEIFQYCGVEGGDDRIAALGAKAQPITKEIDNTSHKRSGRAGQFHQALHPDTVHQIDRLLEKEMKFFGWKPLQEEQSK